MKRVSQKGRKLFRNVLLTLGAGAVSLIFAACYGMPPDYDEDYWNNNSTTENAEEEDSVISEGE